MFSKIKETKTKLKQVENIKNNLAHKENTFFMRRVLISICIQEAGGSERKRSKGLQKKL